MKLDSKIPGGPLADKWDRHKFEVKLVNPANKRKYNIIMVGTGLAGGAAAASRLGELGLQRPQAFCYQDSPRRAHSIAAQGGINAAKNYPRVMATLLFRLMYDTIKGGDFRAREADVNGVFLRFPTTSLISVLLKVFPLPVTMPGYLDNRSFGGAQVSRTFYSRGLYRTAAALGRILWHCPARSRPVRFRWYTRREMLDLVVVDGVARGILQCSNMVTGEIECHAADAVLSGDRRLCQRLSISLLTQRGVFKCYGKLEGYPRKALSLQTPATHRSIRPAFRAGWRVSVQADTYV